MYWYTVGYPIGAGISCTIPGHVLVYSGPKYGTVVLGHCRILAVSVTRGTPLTP